jgi:hypothetical protein
MESTFKCDNCGNEFPLSQMKEVFTEEGTDRTKQRLCPNCLDQRMNEADEVKGVAGEEKRAAVRLVDEPGSSDGQGERESLGQRPT